MKKPFFSICIPVFNDAEYIAKCLESIINQDYKDYEIIVVDDFSHDNSYGICKEYEDRYAQIKAYRNDKNRGSLYTRNFAINKAIGDYIIFIDGDDFHVPNSLKIIDENINKYKCDMLVFGIKSIFPDGSEKEVFYDKDIQIYTKDNRRDFIKKISITPSYNSLCTKVVKRDLFENIIISEDDWNISRGTDKYMSLRLYKYVKDVVIIPDVLYIYRQNNDGITMTQDKKFHIDYRNREQLKDLIYSEDCLTKEDIKDFDLYCYKRFKGQLFQISNLNITKDKKIEYFNEMRNSNYYKKYINNLFDNYGKSVEINMFYNKKYNSLILLEKLKKIIA